MEYLPKKTWWLFSDIKVFTTSLLSFFVWTEQKQTHELRSFFFLLCSLDKKKKWKYTLEELKNHQKKILLKISRGYFFTSKKNEPILVNLLKWAKKTTKKQCKTQLKVKVIDLDNTKIVFFLVFFNPSWIDATNQT